MARKPNYNFERQERERLKRQKNEAKAEEKRTASEEAPDTGVVDPAGDE